MEDRRRSSVGDGKFTILKQIWPILARATAAPPSATIAQATISYTASTLALDVSTGSPKGYFQYHPNDSWDYDEVSLPLMIDYRRSGRTIKGLVDVARDGYVWFLDRASMAGSGSSGGSPRIGFVEAKPYVYSNVIKSVDPVTGHPDIDPDHKPGTGRRADFCPGSHGG
jgi:alcohol dehydrogenase (cytochrome c)